MAKKQHYQYVLTLDAPIWPRKLVDDLSNTLWAFDHLVSVTDRQNNGHIYGDTYTVREDRHPALTGGAAR